MPQERLDQLSRIVADQFKKRSHRMALTSCFVKIFIALAAAYITWVQIQSTPTDGWAILNILASVATSIIFLGTIFTIIIDQDASIALDAARRAIDDTHEINKALDDFFVIRKSLDRSTYLYQAMLCMCEGLERLTNHHKPSEEDIAKALLKVSRRHLLNAMGINYQEHHTIGIYRAEDDGRGATHLRLIAHDRAVDCDPSKARTWEPGVGAVGISYATGIPIIVPNTSSPDMGTVLRTPKTRLGDFDAYRSLAAVPVIVGRANSVWGVCIATSDQQGRFDVESDYGVRSSEAMSALSAVLALALNVHHYPTRAQIFSPGPGQDGIAP